MSMRRSTQNIPRLNGRTIFVNILAKFDRAKTALHFIVQN